MNTADDRAIACLAALVSRPRFAFLADRYVALAEATTRLKLVLQSTEQKIQESKRAMLLVNASRAESSRDCTSGSAEADTQQDSASGQLPDEARRTQSAPLRSSTPCKPSFACGDADEVDMLELPAAPLNARDQPSLPPSPQAPEHCVCNSYACLPALGASPNEGHVANSTAEGHVPLDDCNSAHSDVMAVVGSGVCEPRDTTSDSAPVRNEACAEDHMPTTGCPAHTDDLACADLCPSLPSEPVSPSSESPELQQAQDVSVIQSPQHSVDHFALSTHLSSSPLPSIYPNSFLSRGASPPSEAHLLKYQDAPRKSTRLAAQSQSAETLDAPPSTDPTTPRLLKRLATSASATADSEADHPRKRRCSTRLGLTNDHLPATNDQLGPEIDEASSPQSDEDDSYIDEEDSRSSGDLTRPYACTACDVAFAKVAFLNRHLRGRAHNLEGGAYKCALCGARFVRRHHLSRHLSSAAHGGERGFPCSVEECGQAFTRREHLKRHLQNVHKR
ncbi:hypothetical protein K525DRAFT_287264 [Schizophyllum commune Loenen D]|nr:hypothetical protein K525DRAFT_287264 [Schizophyllum commune Loenen D]